MAANVTFHSPLAEESHMTKPDVSVMGSVLCPVKMGLVERAPNNWEQQHSLLWKGCP